MSSVLCVCDAVTPGKLQCGAVPKGTGHGGENGRCLCLSESDCILFSKLVTEKDNELESDFIPGKPVKDVYPERENLLSL